VKLMPEVMAWPESAHEVKPLMQGVTMRSAISVRQDTAESHLRRQVCLDTPRRATQDFDPAKDIAMIEVENEVENCNIVIGSSLLTHFMGTIGYVQACFAAPPGERPSDEELKAIVHPVGLLTDLLMGLKLTNFDLKLGSSIRSMSPDHQGGEHLRRTQAMKEEMERHPEAAFMKASDRTAPAISQRSRATPNSSARVPVEVPDALEVEDPIHTRAANFIRNMARGAGFKRKSPKKNSSTSSSEHGPNGATTQHANDSSQASKDERRARRREGARQ